MRSQSVRWIAVLFLVAAVGFLGGCATIKRNLPHARFEACFAGACASIDTREATDAVADVATSVTDAVGLTQSAPAAAPAAEPAK